MKKNNKKGFTLIELLAVIVILAILATAAFTLVLPAINRARANTFATEAANMVEVAERYFATHTDVDCVSINKLVKDGEIKGDATKYYGYVAVTNKNTQPTYYIAFTNGTYHTPETATVDGSKAIIVTKGTYKSSYVAIKLSELRDKDGNAATEATYLAGGNNKLAPVTSGGPSTLNSFKTNANWCNVSDS